MVTDIASALDTPKILIVDDRPTNLDALEAMLVSTGCAFVRALSAHEALLRLLRDDFAAIVLDIQMPGMGGIELAALIKQRKRTQHVPILFLTAHLVDEADVLRGYGVGAVDYLSKPINAEILRSKIGGFIELFRMTRALGAANEALQGEIADRQQAQEALQLANLELEQRVLERTAELTRAHRDVRENEERLRLAIEVARIGAWEWHLASDHVTWSTNPEALFGFPEHAFDSDRRLFDALHPDDKATVEQAMATTLETGVYQADYRLVRPDGSIVWLTGRGRLIADSNGTPERVVGITRNVTEDREAALEREGLLREARRARQEAETSSRTKDEFLAMLSHELRNPLNVIAGGLSILERAGSPAEPTARTRALMARQVHHLTALMDDLLDVARLTSGKIALSCRPLDLGAAVAGCLATLTDANLLSRHTCRRTIASVWVEADQTRIEQIITNVVTNAIKFTPAGGEVSVVVSVDGDDAVLRVEDSGAGIAPDLLPRVFDLFVQGERTIERAAGGLGLGLTLVRRLTEMHGGTVTASSEGIGHGASFTVRLPRIAPAPERAECAPRPEFTPARMRVLVVDDNADGREMVRTLLEGQGYEIHEAAEGHAAVARALALQPDAAIIDIGLPGLDGYAVAARIRAGEKGDRRMRLIALTGYGTETDRRRAAQAGFDAHLTKPCDPDRLARLLAAESTDQLSELE